MATMLMQRGDLVTPEKILFSPLMHSRFEAEGGIENPKEEAGLQRGSEGGRYRSRKGKNGQKKQPQRGLGVAQLEKIRLQEQSKHEAACLASLQYLRGMSSFSPSVTLGDHSDAFSIASPFVRQFRAGSRHALSQDDDRKTFGVLSDPVSAGCGLNTKTVDGKAQVYEALMPFPLDPSTPVPYMRPGHGSSLSIVISRKADYEPPLSCLSHCQQISGLKRGDTLSDKANIILTQRRKAEMDAIYELETDGLFPVGLSSLNAMRNSKTAGRASAIKDAETGDILLSGHNLCKSRDGPSLTLGVFDQSIDPPGLHPHKQDCMDMPATLGIPSIGQRPKELSSFQNYPGNNQVWAYEDKMSTLKRKWQSMQENQAIFAMILDPSAGIGDCDRNQHKIDLYGESQTPEIVNAGAHYTTGTVRNALGSSHWPPTKVKYDTATSDWLGALSRFQSRSNCKAISSDNHSSPSNIFQSHAKDGDSSKLSLTTRLRAEDATAFNIEASSGDFLALRLSGPYCINKIDAEAGSRENACAEIELDFKSDSSALPGSFTVDTEGDLVLTAKVLHKGSAENAIVCSENLSAIENRSMLAPCFAVQSGWLPSSESCGYQPTSPLSCGKPESSLITAPMVNTPRLIDLSLKLAL
ncbi:hypothetical protein O6H91_17G024700 [Diphasiastrum complanatum]|uniref:Uncharacterized protein n=6 Tax=Diphasiastrum complanatum TaxID=34168 RepID=A0ACC2B4Z5_DIPCM|nr:hypothetical protein O6H91_17G024700 [Diphasiastrum complanatum]KAJ7524851.1 hypothetical protein O6H91_17G024700 [Diphasiastrum complanatum]KAJ7524854.1 hypothetical protein O6H91_17G024700 [Diphasiastrum complanatum]KAJ7524855.1 hypothetical protein O6H91_17G024700 [Diphasiastrum complanatum]KAJ7524858.1 hypothetical protein O6H91_17G024700 [Diphasiastrum complanatum]